MTERFSPQEPFTAYPPLTALLDFRKEQQDSNAKPQCKKKEVNELGATALMVLALANHPELCASAIVSLDQREHRAPDCLVIDLLTQTILQRVEVVHYTYYSERVSLVDFLRQTKLAPKYRYPDDIHILCHWLGVQAEVDWQEIHQGLRETAIHNPLSVLVRTKKNLPHYQLVQLAPHFSITEFNLISAIGAYKARSNHF